MNPSIEAKYFDGKSSLSLQIVVVFDESMSQFCFQTSEDNSIIWSSKDIQFEQYGSILEIRNKQFSGELIKIDDKDFSESFFRAMRKNKHVDIHTRLLKLGTASISAIALLLLSVIVFAYFYILPPVAEKSAMLLPESFDNEIGNIFMDAFLNDNIIDTQKTKYLEQFASEIDLKNEKPLKFAVVKSNQINAFALPNGQIVVFSAILENMQSKEELAALLGHEASHVNCRHSIKMLCRNLAGYLLVSLLFSDVNGIMAVLADNAQQLHSLSYSRSFEQEADEQGLDILMSNHLNPKGMITLFEQLEHESDFAMPEILSTHPLTDERKNNIQKIISQSHYEVKPNDKLNAIFSRLKN